MDSSSPMKRKYPKVLIEEFAFAVAAFNKIGNSHEERYELLQRFRRNRSRLIATWGILNIGAPVSGLEHVPHEHYSAIARIDEIYCKIQHFLNGGSEDYCAASITELVEKQLNSEFAKHAANIRHAKPGGCREKHKKIREIWASGKYKSRDICAEQECAALDMSFSAARKALKNTPTPK